MERKAFLRGIGVIGVGTLLPFNKTRAAVSEMAKANLESNGGCILIPQETAGPYPFDLSMNPAMFRQDITEGNPGIPMNLQLTVVNVNDNCNPIPDARVDIWHCNKDGYYSEFNNQPGYLGTGNFSGQTFSAASR